MWRGIAEEFVKLTKAGLVRGMVEGEGGGSVQKWVAGSARAMAALVRVRRTEARRVVERAGAGSVQRWGSGSAKAMAGVARVRMVEARMVVEVWVGWGLGGCGFAGCGSAGG